MLENEGTGTETGATGDDGAGAGSTGATADAGDGTATDPAAAGVEITESEYAPNYKFKYRALDRSEAEGEFDDALKPLLKNAEVEKKVRELYEKAHGIDFVKADREALKQSFGETQQAYETQSTALRTLGTFVQNKDFDSFFEALKIPKQDILQYALQQVQISKMSPEERAQFDTQRQAQQRTMALQMQNQELTQQFQTMAVQGRENELAGTLAHPEIAPLIADFDQRAGRTGAFRDLVVQKGQHHFFSSGLDVPVGQVVQEVIQLLGLRPQAPAGQAAAPAAGGARVGSGGKPVLPNVQGKGGASPAKKVPRSTADLRNLANQMAANN